MKKLRKGNKKRFGIGITFLLLFSPIMLIPIFVSFTWALEEPYPNKPINLIVSMAPGGVLDTHGKIIGDRLSEVLGQPVIRVHKPGGGGIFAGSFVAKAKPDGYTLFTGTSSNLILPVAMKKTDYTWEDFIPLGIYCKGVVHLYVKADAPWKTLQEFIEDAKKQQMKVSSYGKNSHADFVIEVFNKQAGIKLAHVPYKSCGEAVTALLGGHVEGDFCTSSIGQVEGGAVRILGLADHERWEILPDVKTFKEQGYPVALPLWYSFCVPKKTPKRVVDILSNAMQEVFKRQGKEIKEELKKFEAQAAFFNSQQSIQEFKKDYEMTFNIAKELGI